ncbi:MAG: threonine-phosphate decarboxylase CobD [bacterium]|nr:threonine-phosphate decarboxylase CobD [bacterium]
MHGGNIKEAIERYNLKGKRILDFSANINPLGPPDYVRDIILDNIDCIKHYPDPQSKELKTMVAQYLGVGEENVIVGNGSMELIYLITKALFHREGLIPSPTFREYESSLKSFGSTPRYLRIREEDDFQLYSDDIIKNLHRSKLLFLCNPNNPTGRMIGREELKTLINHTEKNGVFVVIDEAFIDFVNDAQDESMVNLAATGKNIFVLRSLTKFFALPGLRIGYGVGNSGLIRRLEGIRGVWSVNTFAQAVGSQVLKDKGFIKKTCEFIKEERRYLFDALSGFNSLKPYLSSVNFLLIKLIQDKVNSKYLTQALGKRGIMIRDCSSFRYLNSRFIRIAIRRREDNLCLINNLREVLDLG